MQFPLPGNQHGFLIIREKIIHTGQRLPDILHCLFILSLGHISTDQYSLFLCPGKQPGSLPAAKLWKNKDTGKTQDFYPLQIIPLQMLRRKAAQRAMRIRQKTPFSALFHQNHIDPCIHAGFCPSMIKSDSPFTAVCPNKL